MAMLNSDEVNFVLDVLSDAAIYEQLAEECSELAKASLKKARKLRGENPTPLFNNEIDAAITEEFSDVMLCSKILGLYSDDRTMESKLSRWCNRIKKFRGENPTRFFNNEIDTAINDILEEMND